MSNKAIYPPHFKNALPHSRNIIQILTGVEVNTDKLCPEVV